VPVAVVAVPKVLGRVPLLMVVALAEQRVARAQSILAVVVAVRLVTSLLVVLGVLVS
jgi:hypothetical protein